MKTDPMIGQKFNRLTVLSFAGLSKGNRTYLCCCDCGAEVIKRGSHLRRGEVKSCGCYNQELRAERGRTIAIIHGHSSGHKRTGTYQSWTAMKARCQNTNHIHYDNYGGRGIKVCERWQKFENFLVDMGERPTSTTIDRIDNNGNYEPGNCRWATPARQGNNRKSNHFLDFQGQRKSISDWAKSLGLRKTTIRERLNRGWTVEQALITPVGRGAEAYYEARN